MAAQRAETTAAKVGKTSVTWDEKVTLPVYEGAKELRLLLLAPGVAGAPPRTVANGGFYVEDIMASPSNCKWFELFAPGGNAGEGPGLRRNPFGKVTKVVSEVVRFEWIPTTG